MRHRLRRHDGVYRYMSGRGIPIIADDGEILEWLGVHTDITERKIAELEKERLNRELVELSRRSGMSEGQLSRAFRDAFGMPVFDYVRRQRLQRGHELLQRGRMSVTEVAFSVGYEHVANFSTAFKRAYGKSPQALRKATRLPATA
ncbi:MAG: helix-turn-helix domain-containing protein [Comamonadaceae bacterium]|nr:MAG: helix-turn-helix domain-containing protein [Comamonadaceae bacterium]